MKTPNPSAAAARWGWHVAALLAVLALGACSGLRPSPSPPPAFYSLDSISSPAAPSPVPMAGASPSRPSASTLTLIINPPQAAAGFDSQRIIYVREAHKLDYFANSEWIDPPARMLGPLLVTAIERAGTFRAVVLTPGAATGDWRLDTDIIRLQHEFQTQPSRVRFTLRATLVDDKTRRVLAVREFDRTASAVTDNPHGGVVAANQVVQTVLTELSQFLAERTQ